MDTHLVLGSKGGIGKSLASAFLASFFQSKGADVHCFDTDPQNHTLGGYTAFPVQVLSLIDSDTRQVNTRYFDTFLEEGILPLAELEKSEPRKFCEVIVDNGSATYLPLCAYLGENPVVSTLQEFGDVYIHTLITGGQAQEETIRSLDRMLAIFKTCRFVIWINRFFGKVEVDGKPFTEHPLCNNPAVYATVAIPHLTRETYGKDIEELLSAKLTVAQAVAASKGDGKKLFGIMATQRLQVFEREMNKALEKARLL